MQDLGYEGSWAFCDQKVGARLRGQACIPKHIRAVIRFRIEMFMACVQKLDPDS